MPLNCLPRILALRLEKNRSTLCGILYLKQKLIIEIFRLYNDQKHCNYENCGRFDFEILYATTRGSYL